MFYSSSVGIDVMVGMKIFPGGHRSVLRWEGGDKEQMTFGNINTENL